MSPFLGLCYSVLVALRMAWFHRVTVKVIFLCQLDHTFDISLRIPGHSSFCFTFKVHSSFAAFLNTLVSM